MMHRHTTPFEMVEFKFHCKMPIFVARQWVRHRTANINEYSLRYSEANTNNLIIYFLIPLSLFIIMYLCVYLNNQNLRRN